MTGTFEAAADDYYPDSTATTATVSIGGSTTGSIDFAGDTDWFKVTLEAGHTYEFDLEGAASGQGTLVDPSLRVRDALANSVAYNDDISTSDWDSRVYYAPLTSGTYFVIAASQSGPGTYRLAATDLTAGGDDYLASPATTGVASIGGTTTGSIDFAGDTDWFKVTLVAGYSYEFDLQGADTGHGTLADPCLWLLTSSGSTVAYNDDCASNNQDSRITFTAEANATYFLSAGAIAGSGTYLLSVIQFPQDDYAPTAATTGTVSIGGSTTGSIDFAGDTDWFAVTLEAGHTYQFDLQGAASGQGTLLDPYLRFYDGMSSVITGVDDISRTDWDARITYTATSSGTYYLQSGLPTRSCLGTYRLSALDVTTVNDDYYPNSAATNGALSVGGSVSGDIETVGDTDWFRITLVAGHSYQFDLEGAASGQGTLVDPSLRVRDALANSVAYNDDISSGDWDSRIVYAPTASGTYYLVAASQGGPGTYRLTATDLTAGGDDYLASASTTGVVSIGGSATGSIDFTGDTDWFAVSLVAGTTYEFDLQGKPSGHGTLVDPCLRLLDGSGSSLAYNDDIGSTNWDSQIIFTAYASGTYFLDAGSRGGPGTYRLTASEFTGDDYPAGTMGTVSIGGSTNGSIDYTGDTDEFQVTLTVGHTYEFDLQGSPSGHGTLVDPCLWLMAGSGENSMQEDYNDDVSSSDWDSRIIFTPTAVGEYYLIAGSRGGPGTYRLTATDLTTATGDDYPASTATTGTVSIGGSTTGSIDFVSDTDWFKVTLVAGTIYQFDLQGSWSGNGTLTDPCLWLRDGSGNGIAYNDDAGGSDWDSKIVFKATSSGTYYLEAGSRGGPGTYRLSASAYAGDDYASSTATTGLVGIGGTTFGIIDSASDTDWFAVTLEAGRTYEFDVRGIPTPPLVNQSLQDPCLWLLDGSGNVLAYDDNISSGNWASRITFTATASGTYFLDVGSKQGPGEYALSAAYVSGGA